MTVSTLPRRTAQPNAAATRHAAEHCIGVVIAADEDGLSVQSDEWLGAAQRADGCLLDVQVGDTVACLVDAQDQCLWVLTVLRRAPGSSPRIRCNGELTLSADQLRLEGAEVSLHAQRSTLCSDETTVIGREMSVTSQLMNLAGEVLSTVFDRVTHFSQQHLRTTEGMDRVEANYLESSAKQLHRTQAKQVLVNGEQLVKTRGKQIHFG